METNISLKETDDNHTLLKWVQSFEMKRDLDTKFQETILKMKMTQDYITEHLKRMQEKLESLQLGNKCDEENTCNNSYNSSTYLKQMSLKDLESRISVTTIENEVKLKILTMMQDAEKMHQQLEDNLQMICFHIGQFTLNESSLVSAVGNSAMLKEKPNQLSLKITESGFKENTSMPENPSTLHKPEKSRNSPKQNSELTEISIKTQSKATTSAITVESDTSSTCQIELKIGKFSINDTSDDNVGVSSNDNCGEENNIDLINKTGILKQNIRYKQKQYFPPITP